MKYFIALFTSCLLFFSCQKSVPPPEPFGAIPSQRQLEWHKMKYYAFVHFGPNTFTNKEWGFGDEPEGIFNPGELSPMQWAKTAKDAGLEAIILTAKHHDGFCLWPTSTTEHSVKNSPWKNGEGDLLLDLRRACDEYGLKMGIYLSPWDRNHETYGTPEYIEVYRTQMRELLSNYGEIFEFWFDGANGGDGYYGGANEIRKIDNRTYYDWPNSHKIVRELQPLAIMFSDGGPDIRWVGNERGYAGETNWSTVNEGAFYPGIGGVNDQLQSGHEGGNIWLPTEVNTSIRPGWFYHPEQDSLVKSLEQLADNWFHSVGMNGNFLLNIPPDTRGLFHENDVARLIEFKQWRDKSFINLISNSNAISSNERGAGYAAELAVDNNKETFWAADDKVLEASITLDFPDQELNALLIQEYIALGQRVRSFSVEVFYDGEFVEVANGTTIGNRRIVRFPSIETSKIRLTVNAKAAPLIHTIEAYKTIEIDQ